MHFCYEQVLMLWDNSDKKYLKITPFFKGMLSRQGLKEQTEKDI